MCVMSLKGALGTDAIHRLLWAKRSQVQPMCECMLSRFSHVWLFVTPWTVAPQAPLSTGFSSKNTGVGFHFLFQGIFPSQGSNPHLLPPELAGRFFTTVLPGKPWGEMKGPWFCLMAKLLLFCLVRFPFCIFSLFWLNSFFGIWRLTFFYRQEVGCVCGGCSALGSPPRVLLCYTGQTPTKGALLQSPPLLASATAVLTCSCLSGWHLRT